MPPPMITGLYPYVRRGVWSHPSRTLTEIGSTAVANPGLAERLVILAGDAWSAEQLEERGLAPARVFDDAPSDVRADMAHKMKHWMCLWALRQYGEFLWVDWDAVIVREPDDAFWAWARAHDTPKFISIRGYRHVVNCGVYYAGAPWAEAMERSFDAVVSEPNDELLWASVLPPDVVACPEYWWGDRAVNVWTEAEIERVGANTYFAHVGDVTWAGRVRARSIAGGT